MLAYIYIPYIYGYIPIYQHHGSVMGVEVFFFVNRILGYPETQPPPMISGEKGEVERPTIIGHVHRKNSEYLHYEIDLS